MEFNKLFVAPINIRSKFLKLIKREIKNVKNGKQGHLILKMNSLVDPTIIAALYEASKNKVRIDLIVRGICCLKPGVPGLSDNIYVRSIVGRYLEHSRAYYFFNDGNDELYLSSADLMQRNLDRRVEIIFPVENEHNKNELKKNLLDACLKDTEKSRILLPTGKYVRNKAVITQQRLNVHEWSMTKVATESEAVKIKIAT